MNICAIMPGKTLPLQAVFTFTYGVLSLFVLLHFLHNSLLGDYYFGGRTSFESMMHGTAWRPFAYRLLVPKLVAAITWLTPDFVQYFINSTLYAMKAYGCFDPFRDAMPWLDNVFPDKNHIYSRLVAIGIIYGCLLGYVSMLRRLAHQCFPADPAVADFAPIFGLIAITAFSMPMQYLYDIPVLFLSTACYYCMATRKLRTYLVWFTLACLNKETSVFVLLFFMLWFYGRLDAREYRTYCKLQWLIFIAIRLAVMAIYTENSGSVLERHIAEILENDIFLRTDYKSLLSFCFLFFLLTYRWMQKPLFLKYVFLIFPFVVLAYLFFGKPGEYRVCFDILPLIILLMTHTLTEAAGFSQRTRDETHEVHF